MTFTHLELNIIGLALCGRLKEEQIPLALELNKRLLEQKKITLTQHLEMVEKALDSLE